MGLISGILFGIIFGVALMAGWSRMMTHRSSKRVAKVKWLYKLLSKMWPFIAEEVPENKRRVSIVKGIVIAKRNAGLNSTFRIRRLVAGVGVESMFPLQEFISTRYNVCALGSSRDVVVV